MPVPGEYVATSAAQTLVYTAHVVFFRCPNIFVSSVISEAFHGVSGAVFKFLRSLDTGDCGFYFGVVRCSAVRFSLFQTNTVRCSAVFLLHGAVRYRIQFSRIGRCGAVRCRVM